MSSPPAKWFGQGENRAVGAGSTTSLEGGNWTFIESSTFPGTYVVRQRDPLGGDMHLYLDLSGNSVADGIALVTTLFDGSPSQHWILEKDLELGTRYRLKNRFSRKYVTISAAKGSSPLLLESFRIGNDQLFEAAPNL
ncbi:RICIN domain-containing protein [Kribbella sp. NPDC023855]|uniref:RICIN domain-containing protein n=1 Tax=Kribbella sp. NPDC023855 TaxID=3154698 RepID=UPI00340A8541